MRHPWRAAGMALALAIGANALAAQDDVERPPFFVDPNEGFIDGRVAANVFPVVLPGAGGSYSFLDPRGHEAHLSPVDEAGGEQVYPAGTWFIPPTGRHRVWLESGWRMSPYSMLIGYGGGSAAAGIRIAIPMTGAGRVALPEGWSSGSGEDLHLLHAGPYRQGRHRRWEIFRRTPTGRVGEGLLLPAGTAFGGVWSERDEAYLAISRPFQVRQGGTTAIELEKPLELAHLVVELRRTSGTSMPGDQAVEVALERDGRRLPPDLRVRTADRVHAVWYDLEPGAAVLRAESAERFGVRRPLTLTGGRIDRVVCALEPLPSLEVALDLPREVREGDLALELRLLPGGELVERRPLSRDAETSHFERLPPEVLEVRLGTRFGAFAEPADLRSGEDASVLLAPDLIALEGTVYHGGRGRPARIELTTVKNEPLEARTGPGGAYRLVALRPLRSASVTLDGIEAAPFVDVYWRPIDASRRLDFHFPQIGFTVRVLDAATGRGIANAAVATRNSFAVDEEEPAIGHGDDAGGEEPHRRVIAQVVTADEEGVARLPPLRPGTVEIAVYTEGYEALPEPVVTEVSDPAAGGELEVRLRPSARRDGR